MSSDYRCVKCGKQAPGKAPYCPTCKTCLLVDVVVDASGLDRRAIYLAARDIDILGASAPTFDEVKSRLQVTPSCIAPECTRALAHTIVGILHHHSIPTRLVPLRRPRRKIIKTEGTQRRLRSIISPLTSVVRDLSPNIRLAIVGLLIVAFFSLYMSRRSNPEISRPSSQTLSGDRTTALSSREIVFAAIRSSAQVAAPHSPGIGFFITPELLVTSAKLAGPKKTRTEIVLPDGRRLKGVVEKSDEWIDLALVRVPGANAPFLELGDATQLERGETIMAVSHTRALEFTASQGIVNHTAWVELGISYLMIDANFATSGGPILDRFARVVGVVTSDTATRSDLRLAAPINYLTSGEEALFPFTSSDNAVRRWQAILATAKEKEKSQIAEARANSNSPSLIKASIVNSDTIEIVLARFAATTPSREELHFEILRDENILCTTSSIISEWRATSRNAEEISKNRLLQWFQHHHINGNFYSARSHLMPYDCSNDLLGTTLVLSSADPRADRVVISGKGR